ncbi:hypothetical protein [Streptomyces lydicus]|uniref:hypothetical protein n=1 Tax=Streptomyces lydicus TaxID=47763 RepID=UPI000B25EC3E|nr:hypothetical protein [Streptomyces lydicus]
MPKAQNRKSGNKDRAAERRSDQQKGRKPSEESASERTQDLKRSRNGLTDA